MRSFAALILICLGGFTGTALAAEAVAVSDPSLPDIARQIFDAVMHGQWWAAAALGVIGATAAARRYVMPASWKEGTKGDIVGTASVFVLSFAGAILTWAVAPGATMSVAVALTALKVSAAAIGGYTIIHKLVGWLVAWGKLPAWAVSALKLVTMMIGSSAIKKAEAAGDAAVAAKPSTGLAGNTTVREVE